MNINTVPTQPPTLESPKKPFRKGVGGVVIVGALIAFYQYYNMIVNPPCVSWGVFDDVCEPRPRQHWYPAILLIYGGGFALLYAVYQFVRRRRAYALGVVVGVVLSVVMFYAATMIHWFLE